MLRDLEHPQPGGVVWMLTEGESVVSAYAGLCGFVELSVVSQLEPGCPGTKEMG